MSVPEVPLVEKGTISSGELRVDGKRFGTQPSTREPVRGINEIRIVLRGKTGTGAKIGPSVQPRRIAGVHGRTSELARDFKTRKGQVEIGAVNENAGIFSQLQSDRL